MTRIPRIAGGIALAFVSVALLGLGSRWSWTATADDHAVIRLDWRARPERVEKCRPLTVEERAELPPHMRPSEVCEGSAVPYRLRLEVDRRVLIDDVIGAADDRGDRPLYVSQDVRVRPGVRELRIAFLRVPGTEEVRREPEREPDEAHEAGEDHDVPEIHDAATTPSLRLDETVRLAPREVLVVRYDSENRTLIAEGSGGS